MLANVSERCGSITVEQLNHRIIKDKNMIRSYEELKKTIVDHLFWDDSIDASGVKV
jgi:hypothetical protein